MTSREKKEIVRQKYYGGVHAFPNSIKGLGWGIRNFAVGLPGGENLKRSDFDDSDLF